MSEKCECKCHWGNSDRCVDCSNYHGAGGSECNCNCHMDNVRSCGDCRSEHPESYGFSEITTNIPSNNENRFIALNKRIDEVENENKRLRRDDNRCAIESQDDFNKKIDELIKLFTKSIVDVIKLFTKRDCDLKDNFREKLSFLHDHVRKLDCTRPEWFEKHNEKIKKIEKLIDSQIENDHKTLGHHVINLCDACRRIEKLEDWQDIMDKDYAQFKLGYPKMIEVLVEDNVKNIHLRLDELENHVKKMTESYIKNVVKNAVPYICPVCEGARIIEKPNFQDGEEIKYQCRTCEGKGVIWG